MVDCFDRIAVQMTEIALEPILQLADQPAMTAATVRLPGNGRRVLLTISKRTLAKSLDLARSSGPVASHLVCEDEPTITYAWKLEHSDDTGNPDGVIAANPAVKRYPRPEDAFWGAVDALRDADFSKLDAGSRDRRSGLDR